jgi:Mrp family chromosome partitioning ATPase
MSVVEKAIAKLRAPGTAEATRPSDEAHGLEDTVSTVEQAIPVMPAAPEIARRTVSVDRDDLRSRGFLPDSDQERRLADQYRQVKRTILTRLQELDPLSSGSSRWFMFTSALPGDGKTFTSINMAFSLAREPAACVVLVDGDLPKRHVSQVFGVEKEPGLFDALADDAVKPESLVLPTNVPGLSILPAGTYHESGADQLTDDRVLAILSRIVAQDPRRIVVLDSPPLLLSGESKALAQAVGNVVLVVRAGGTPQRAVQDAVSQLGPEKLIGIVLNQSPMAQSEGYYGYSAYGESGASDKGK